ncbi:MAG: hypothetical protein ACSHYB_08940 [Roseibacillus sp.]
MDLDFFAKLLLFLLVVGTGVLLAAAWRADSANSTWATRCQLFSGLGLFLSIGLGFLFIVLDADAGNSASNAWAVVVGISAIVFIIGVIGFCARFGATCRRITQLEEIESALSTAVAHSAAQSQRDEGQSS